MAASFLKELEQLTNPAPIKDYVDHEDEETIAKVVAKSSLQDYEDADDSQSHLRERGLRRAVILSEEDERYTGTVVCRSVLDDDEVEMDESEEGLEERPASDESEEGQRDEDASEDYENEVKGDQDDDLEEEGEEVGDVVLEQRDNESTGLVKVFSSVDVKDENAKGRAVQAQIKLWEQLLGARIRFQRVLSLVNQLPQTEDDWQNLWSEIQNADEAGAKKSADEQQSYDGCRQLRSTLDELIKIQDRLLKLNNVLDGGFASSASRIADDDDEIVSSPDEDEEVRKSGNDEKKSKKRRLNDLDDYANFLEERHAALKAFRDHTVLKWFEKTRLASGRFNRSSFSAFENNTLQQIEHILSDKDRLIKRTQLKRSAFTILGKSHKLDETANGTDRYQEYNEEIFDDDDFYQQLLRELIEKRTVEITDPVALSRQWLELQKLRSKSKKKHVDRKASKGRRCRYDVVPKLVNFMAPADHCVMTDEAREELFESLFKNVT